MAEFGEENNNVFGGIQFEDVPTQEQVGNIGGVAEAGAQQAGTIGNEGTDGVFKRVEAEALPAKQSVWSKIRSFLFQEIDLMQPITVELTPYQQKIEDEINAFLHQEVSFKGFFGLFKKQK